MGGDSGNLKQRIRMGGGAGNLKRGF